MGDIARFLGERDLQEPRYGKGFRATTRRISRLENSAPWNPIRALSITRWLKSPPRDIIKLLATVVEALEQIDEVAPAQQLALIREWRTGTLSIENGQFKPHEKGAIRTFCQRRSFDLAYYPQMAESEANRYNQLAEPIYFRAAQEVLFGDREQFYGDYSFHVRSATDHRPYFFQFLRLNMLIQMVQSIGMNAIPFVEWGYLLLIVTLIQAVVVGLILILLPLLFLRKRPVPVRNNDIGSNSVNNKSNRPTINPIATYWHVFGYFFSLGIGFMLIEMAFIQKFLLLLSYPTYAVAVAVAVVLCAFLIFARLGSFCCGWVAEISWKLGLKNSIAAVISMLSLVALVYLFILTPIFRYFLASPDAIKITLSITLIAPLAFFMGMPFPLGINLLRAGQPDLIAWAWGINGYASVVSAVLATCLAIAFGFNAVILLAIGVYIVGAWSAPS